MNETFAIFEKDAIATTPLSLDITGTLGVYLIKGYSEKLYNLATQDKDVELLFCFQDKEEDPESLYVVQIFKSKFTDTDLNSGSDTLEVSFPYQSFEERAVRIFRLRTKKADVTLNAGGDTVTITAADTDVKLTASDVSVTVTVDGIEAGTSSEFADNVATITLTDAPTTGAVVAVKVVYDGRIIKKSYTVA